MTGDAALGLGARGEAVGAALRWIQGVLDGAGVPWLVVGGLAARVHGARRAHDAIDILADLDALAGVWPQVEPYRLEGPEHRASDCWQATACRFSFQGEEVHVADVKDVRVRDAAHGTWHDVGADLGTGERHSVLGVVVPVIGIGPLIAWKRRMDRPGDREDLAQLGPRLFSLLTGGAGVIPRRGPRSS